MSFPNIKWAVTDKAGLGLGSISIAGTLGSLPRCPVVWDEEDPGRGGGCALLSLLVDRGWTIKNTFLIFSVSFFPKKSVYRILRH